MNFSNEFKNSLFIFFKQLRISSRPGKPKSFYEHFIKDTAIAGFFQPFYVFPYILFFPVMNVFYKTHLPVIIHHSFRNRLFFYQAQVTAVFQLLNSTIVIEERENEC